jgi:hypothetical protein
VSVLHAYHLYADGEWSNPAAEHLDALARAGYEGPFLVGAVGTVERRREALDWIASRRPIDRTVEADSGFEQVTLRKVRDLARKHPKGLSLYAHTKGAHRPGRLQDAWRRSMTCALLATLDVHVQTLRLSFFDAIGCHWLTPESSGGEVPWPHFAGNFWLARNEFLAGLPPVRSRARHDAEGWLGSGSAPPRVLDLNPGWPGTVPWLERLGWPR